MKRAGGGDLWRSLEGFLREPDGTPEGIARLFAGAGYAQARLAWSGDEEHVVLAAGEGGGEVITAPLDGGRLVLRAAAIDAGLQALFVVVLHHARPRAEAAPRVAGALYGLVGDSAPLREALARLARLAGSDLPVLILGETGTGKELAARSLHARSARARRPFLPINCAALSETLLLADLFGHARGAFTGAERERVGVFEAARGGTVFLDEIGDLPRAAQGMLLRVLQEGEVRRLGESRPRSVDVRVVAATHRDLPRMAAEGSFRRDLLYRLRVGKVELPPLRERGADVLLLAEHFLGRAAKSGVSMWLSSAARERLLGHGWPGNVRELENVLAAAAALADSGAILPRHLDLPAASGGRSGTYHEQLAAFRRRLVEEALASCGGNRAQAARRLGLSRQALSYLVRQLAIA